MLNKKAKPIIKIKIKCNHVSVKKFATKSSPFAKLHVELNYCIFLKFRAKLKMKLQGSISIASRGERLFLNCSFSIITENRYMGTFTNSEDPELIIL